MQFALVWQLETPTVAMMFNSPSSSLFTIVVLLSNCSEANICILDIISIFPTIANTTLSNISPQVFGPEDAAATIQAAVNAAYALNGGQPDIGQFSPHRCHGRSSKLQTIHEHISVWWPFHTCKLGVAQSHRVSCV